MFYIKLEFFLCIYVLSIILNHFRNQISLELYLNLRYDKTDCSLMCSRIGSSDKITDFLDCFVEKYVHCVINIYLLVLYY